MSLFQNSFSTKIVLETAKEVDKKSIFTFCENLFEKKELPLLHCVTKLLYYHPQCMLIPFRLVNVCYSSAVMAVVDSRYRYDQGCLKIQDTILTPILTLKFQKLLTGAWNSIDTLANCNKIEHDKI